jgi:amphi-Trp domain-containing protein
VEKAVPDVKVEQKQVLSRQEAARFIAALADGLGEDGNVTLRLGNTTLELSVASQVDCELEVTVDGDEIELELELTWSTSGRIDAEAADDADEDDAAAEGAEAEGAVAEEENAFAEEEAASAAEEDASPESQSVENDSTADDAADDASDEDADVSDEAASEQAAAPDDAARPRRGRRGAPSGAGKAFNGVDNAAVRAWAAANGVSVSPRGRIRDEVIEAYRAAGH